MRSVSSLSLKLPVPFTCCGAWSSVNTAARDFSRPSCNNRIFRCTPSNDGVLNPSYRSSSSVVPTSWILPSVKWGPEWHCTQPVRSLWNNAFPRCASSLSEPSRRWNELGAAFKLAKNASIASASSEATAVPCIVIVNDLCIASCKLVCHPCHVHGPVRGRLYKGITVFIV